MPDTPAPLTPDALGAFAVALAAAGLVLVVSWVLARLARGATLRALGRTRADRSTALLVGRFAFIAVLAIGVLTALGLVGVPWTTVLALTGAVAVAIGLALQDVLKNVVAGIYLLVERPFRIGEEIKIKEFTGRVESVDVRTTVLRTADGESVLVPNAILFAEVILNRGAGSTRSLADGQSGDQRAG